MTAEDLESVHRLPAAADDVVDMVAHGQVVGEADSQHLAKSSRFWCLAVWVNGRSETCVGGP